MPSSCLPYVVRPPYYELQIEEREKIENRKYVVKYESYRNGEKIVEMKNKCHGSARLLKSVRKHEKIIKRKFPLLLVFFRSRNRKESGREKYSKICYECCVEL